MNYRQMKAVWKLVWIQINYKAKQIGVDPFEASGGVLK
jgi:hypothetical protein